jgi:hypothetical protein
MNKKVLVLGCSHSDFENRSNFKNENDSQLNYELPWNWFIAERYPNMEVHNYALEGMSNFYTDFILKKVISERHHYDAVIINLIESSRFTIPLNLNSKFMFTVNRPASNYINYKLTASYARVFHNRINMPGYQKQTADSFDPQFLKDLGKYTPDSPFISFYNKSFLRSLELYENYFDNFFYWCAFPDKTTRNNKNNIGQPLSAIDFLYKNYGENYTVKYLLEPGLHFNQKGAEILFDEYVMPSKIGDFLKG